MSMNIAYEIVAYTEQGREVVDTVDTWKEAKELLLDYRLAYRRRKIYVAIERTLVKDVTWMADTEIELEAQHE